MHESIVDVEEMRPCWAALMGKEEPVREVRRDQMGKVGGERDDCQVSAADRNNDVGAIEFDQLARLFWTVRHHDRIEAAAPQRVIADSRTARRKASLSAEWIAQATRRGR